MAPRPAAPIRVELILVELTRAARTHEARTHEALNPEVRSRWSPIREAKLAAHLPFLAQILREVRLLDDGSRSRLHGRLHSMRNRAAGRRQTHSLRTPRR